jgi:6-phospho 3-hexuloisomerase
MDLPHQELLRGLEGVLEGTAGADFERLLTLLDAAPRVFVAGAGRSALALRFFAMRLMHCGLTVYVVGDVVTPAIAPGDLLLVLSGSGATETLLPVARKAREAGARVLLITTRPDSPLAAHASELLPLGADGRARPRPGMPMGTLFELSALVYLEGLVHGIIGRRALSEELLRSRHANLE